MPRNKWLQFYLICSREELLADILKRRETFADLKNALKKEEKEESLKKDEEKLKRAFDDFRKKTSEAAAKGISALRPDVPPDVIEKIIEDSISQNSPDLGLKSVVDSQKKRVLISQTRADKPFADIIYQMLLHNSIVPDDILYTNCDEEVCRVPEGHHVYDYLRKFFVESYSKQKIFAIFVTSENTKYSWGAITEVGAAWITQIDHKIFNIHPFRPEHPLDDEAQWQSTSREGNPPHELWMTPLDADIFCQKIESVCDALGYKKRSRKDNLHHLGTLISVRAS